MNYLFERKDKQQLT